MLLFLLASQWHGNNQNAIALFFFRSPKQATLSIPAALEA